MQYGINPLSIVAVRNEPWDTSEMVTQLLYGEVFKIIDNRKSGLKLESLLIIKRAGFQIPGYFKRIL